MEEDQRFTFSVSHLIGFTTYVAILFALPLEALAAIVGVSCSITIALGFVVLPTLTSKKWRTGAVNAFIQRRAFHCFIFFVVTSLLGITALVLKWILG